MDRFSDRENVVAADSTGDVNFSGVFGGPPRRSSMYETRQRYSADSDAVDGEEEEEERLPYRAQWPGMREKAVFGEDTSNHRRRRRANDFYNDIFRSDESSSSTPTKQHPFSSSRVLSPVQTPKPDPFASSPFSLSPKLPKVMDLPTFGSSPRGSRSSKDLDSEGINFSSSPRVTLSRFSSESFQDQEWKNDIHSFYRQSSLSRQVSHNSEDLSTAVLSERTDEGGNSKTAVNSSEVLGDGPQFHFSIYKWASKGVPLMMPPRGRNSSRSKEMGKTEKTSSLKGSMPNENVEGKSTTATPSSLKGSLPNENLEGKSTTATPRDINKPSLALDSNKKDNGLLLGTSNQSRGKSSGMVEEEIISLPKPATVSRVQRTVEDYSWDTIFNSTREKMEPNSHSEVGLGGKLNKETPTAEQETHKANDLKPLRSHLSYSIEQDNHDKSVNAGRNKGNKKAVAEKNQAGKNMKKQEEKQNSLVNTEVVAGVDDSPRKPEKSLGRNRVRGKMKEFVKIFNQEVSSKAKTVVDPRSQTQSCRWNGTFRPEKEASRHVPEKNQKLQPHPNKEAELKDATIMELKNVTPSEVDEYLRQSEERYSATQTENYTISTNTSEPEYTSVSSTAPVPDVPETVVADTDESFHQDFVMEELPLEENGEPEPDKDREVKQIIDAKIRKWSNGKAGNIRSLLSTLQYVLWPECGWKPVPLVSIIEGNAVKRSYQRALLCLHPDKLQQKGASSDQKYTAEKVFDILQEAWDQFNSLGSL